MWRFSFSAMRYNTIMDFRISVLVIVFGALLLLAGGLFVTGTISQILPQPQPRLATQSYRIGESVVRLMRADTPAAQQQGLSGVKRLGRDEGMIFTLNQPAQISFWNKATLLDLDLLWIRGDRVVGIDQLLNEPEHGRIIKRSPGLVDSIVELPFGWSAEHDTAIGNLFEEAL